MTATRSASSVKTGGTRAAARGAAAAGRGGHVPLACAADEEVLLPVAGLGLRLSRPPRPPIAHRARAHHVSDSEVARARRGGRLCARARGARARFLPLKFPSPFVHAAGPAAPRDVPRPRRRPKEEMKLALVLTLNPVRADVLAAPRLGPPR